MNLIEFGTNRVQDEWCSGFVEPKLAMIFLEAAVYARKALNAGPLVVTSIHRTAEEDAALGGTGIHVAWRAIDVKAPSWDDKTSAQIATHMNIAYSYDPGRPNLQVALFREHGTGPHVHYQVHQNTRPR